MLTGHELKLRSPDIERFTRLTDFSRINPQFANCTDLVRKLAHLRHALRFGHKPPTMCRAGAIATLRARRDWKPLLNGVGTATGASRAVLALLELESQHVEQAIDTVRKRLE